MKIDLPTWIEIEERKEQLEGSNRTIAQSVMSGHELNPVEQFIYDNEPLKGSTEWRKSLVCALENAFMYEAV